MISEANTLVNEQTVMVEFQTALFAEFAVFCRRGLNDKAGLAKIKISLVRTRVSLQPAQGDVVVLDVHFHKVTELVMRAIRLLEALAWATKARIGHNDFVE